MYANSEHASSSAMAHANALEIVDGSAEDAGLKLSITLESTELLRGSRAIAIRHNGALYRLQSTKLGKLILTK